MAWKFRKLLAIKPEWGKNAEGEFFARVTISYRRFVFDIGLFFGLMLIRPESPAGSKIKTPFAWLQCDMPDCRMINLVLCPLVVTYMWPKKSFAPSQCMQVVTVDDPTNG